MLTPIKVWPTPQHRGKPGYSSHHFARVGATDDSPLRVAARYAVRWDAAEVCEQAKAMAARDGWNAAASWQASELTRRGAELWVLLSASFSAVVEILEKAYQSEPSPTLRGLLSEARRKARKNGGPNA